MDNCDDILLQVLKECKTLPSFLDAVFGFLKRRTDFYLISNNPKSAVGLPPRMAQNIVQQTFHKWETDKPNLTSNTTSSLSTKSSTAKTTAAVKPNPATYKNAKLPGSYNGAICDKYMWSQTINELDINVQLPENAASKLNVKIEAKHIFIQCKSSNTIILDAELSNKVKHTSALWSVDQSSKKMEIHVDKANELWWDRLFINDEPLDVTKLDCSRPFDELSQEAQSKIEELKWNQDRKAKGMLTSEQERMQTILKNSWHMEGSPFRGPYDPSIVDLDPK